MGVKEWNAPEESMAGKIIQFLNQNIFKRLVNIIRNVHAIAKNRTPFTDFVFFCEFDEMKGEDIGQTYRNAKQVVTFVYFIAKVNVKKL